MKPLNRRITLPILMLCAITANASPKNVSPFFNAAILIYSVKNAPVEKNTAKVCACQLLDVKSNNEDFQNLAVFAEKTNNGDVPTEKQAALAVLQKEHKNLKNFYSTITVKREIVAMSDCSTLVKQLRGAYDNLKVFETLDADIRLKISR